LLQIHLLHQAHHENLLHPLDLVIQEVQVLQVLLLVLIVLGHLWDPANLSYLLYQGVQAFQGVQQNLVFLGVLEVLSRPSFLLLQVLLQVLEIQGRQGFQLHPEVQLVPLYLEFLFPLVYQVVLGVRAVLGFLYLPWDLIFPVFHACLEGQPNQEVLCVLVILLDQVGPLDHLLLVLQVFL